MDALEFWINTSVRREAPEDVELKTVGDVAVFVTRYRRPNHNLARQ